MKKNNNSLVVLLFIIIVVLVGYITYSELNRVKLVPKETEKPSEQITIEDDKKYYELYEDYYGEIAYDTIPYELKYKDYKVSVGSWTNSGSPINITDKNGKSVYSFTAKSNYSVEDNEISFLPYIDNNGKLYFVGGECNSKGPYLRYIDLNDSKLKIIDEKDLSDYNLIPDGDVDECVEVE